MPGVADVFGHALGAFVVEGAAAGNHFPEGGVSLVGAVGDHLVLEQPLGKVPQMNHKPAEIQGFPVKGPQVPVKIFHHFHRPVDEAGDVVHLAHIGVELGVDNVEGDEGGLVGVELHPALGADHVQASLAQMILGGVIAEDAAGQRVLELNSLGLALDGKADVIGQGDEEGFVEGLADFGADGLDHLFGQVEMFQRNLFHQFPQPALTGLVLHPVDFFHAPGVHELAHLPAEPQAPAGDNALVSLFVDDAQDVVVDDFFDAHPAASLSQSACDSGKTGKRKTNPCNASLSKMKRHPRSWSSPHHR